MTNQEAIRLVQNLPTMCEFTDAYGEPIDSDAYYEAVNMAISALQAQEAKYSTESSLTQKALDTISRQEAIDALMKIMDRPNHADFLYTDEICKTLNNLPSAEPEIIRCKDCKNIWRSGTANLKGVPVKIYKCKLWNNRAVSEKGFCYMAERRAND